MAKIKGFLGLKAESKAQIPDDGQVANIRFQNLEVKAGDQNPAFVAIQVESFTLQLSENAAELHVRLDIQGYAITLPGTRALLVAHIGNTTTATPFSPVSGLPVSSDEGFKQFEQEFLQELQATVSAGVDVQTTLFLLAERDSGDERIFAYLSVASLDFSLDPGTV